VSELWIKICGLRDRAAIEAAAGQRVQAMGFVFHEPSPRNVSIADARKLRAWVPEGVDRVAVFLHPSQDALDAAIEALQPHWVQVDHGDLERLRLPVGQRVLSVLRTHAPGSVPKVLPTTVLFEGAHSGAGERADWTEGAHLARRTQVVLAGGLDAKNVAEAIRAVRPFGVDVSSGVESARGVKDPERIREFVGAARAAQSRLAGAVTQEIE
jgi:phosphoribosylanthranilate isomerase